MGLYVTPINWHLAADEAAYIVDDCEAAALVASADLGAVLDRLRRRPRAGERSATASWSAATVEGFEDYEAALAAQPTEPVEDQCEGTWMLYSSGTTGRPKGIKPPSVGGPLGASDSFCGLVPGLYGFGESSVYLSPAPLYHAAPAGWTNAVQRLGRHGGGDGPVRPDRDAAAHRGATASPTCSSCPTHLVRLLKLPAEERDRFDLSSLRGRRARRRALPARGQAGRDRVARPDRARVLLGQRGRRLLRHRTRGVAGPSRVGRPVAARRRSTCVDEAGAELGARRGRPAVVREPEHASSTTAIPRRRPRPSTPNGWTSLGDMGRVDDEGYVYLTDRVTNMIISGGVNIYPREIEDVLIGHPAVADVAVVGVPDPEMGERCGRRPVRDPVPARRPGRARGRADRLLPRAAVELQVPALGRRSSTRLPRLPTGKLAKRLLPPRAPSLPDQCDQPAVAGALMSMSSNMLAPMMRSASTVGQVSDLVGPRDRLGQALGVRVVRPEADPVGADRGRSARSPSPPRTG